jgi:hypothetical protein
MFTSDELVFVWPIGKAFLVVIGSVGILVYAAWVGTKRMASGDAKQESDAVRVGNQQPVAWQGFSIRDSARQFISRSLVIFDEVLLLRVTSIFRFDSPPDSR